MNNKNKGEIGERIAIGELAKFGIDVLLPMSDNLPFDFVIYHNNKMFKCQVKSSFVTSPDSEGSVTFSLTSNNWNTKQVKIYNGSEIDIFILCDGHNIYLFRHADLIGRRTVNIRMVQAKNNQVSNTTNAKDVVLSKERLEYVLN